MLARESRRRCPAFTSRGSVTTLKPLSRHSCQTGERRTVPSRRYVARTARCGSSSRSPRSSGVSPLRTRRVSHERADLRALAQVMHASLDWLCAWRNQLRSGGVTISDVRAITRTHLLVGLGVVVVLAAASTAEAALAFRFNRASARPGQYVVAFEPGWRAVPSGVIVYVVPTRLPGVTPDGAGSYILRKAPAHHTIRLGHPRL